MKDNQKKTIRFTGMYYTIARDNQPSIATAEAYGNNQDTVLKKVPCSCIMLWRTQIQY